VSGGSSEVTVGYKYYLGIHMALAHGPLDSITRIEVDRRVAWEGLNTGGAITVDARDLFGGDEREGGVSGTVSIEMGANNQEANSYLLSVLGDDVPAFRGVACAVLEQVYTGNNPYLKPWSFRAQRIHTTSNGDVQWYDEKAAINKSALSPDVFCSYSCDAYEKYHSDPSVSVAMWPLDDPNFSLFVPAEFRKGFNHSFELKPRNSDINSVMSEVGSGISVIEWYNLAQTGIGICEENLKSISLYHNYNIWDFDRPLTISPAIQTGGAARIKVSFLFRGIQNRLDFRAYAVLNHVNLALNPASSLHELRVDLTRDAIYSGPAFPNDNQLRVQIRHADYSGLFFQNYVPPVLLGQDIMTDGKMHYISIDIYPDGPSFIVNTGTPGQGHIFQKWVYRIRVDNIIAVGGFTERVVTTVSNTSGGSWALSSEPVKIGARPTSLGLYMLSWNREGYSDAEAYLAFLRNFADYEPPDECFSGCPDMNPAHIIRECLTDNSWGMGYSGSDIDDDAFTYAADQLFNEGMGISLVWSQEMPLEDFIAEILRHIDGVLYVSRVTGKFVLKLIRDDASQSDMLVLNESNVSRVTDARRPAVGELVASLTVNYWDSKTGETGSVTEHNQALYQIQTGGGGATTVQYPGFTSFNLAARVARRDLRALSTPLLSCSVEVNRDAELLNIGDAFILDWPDLQINSQVMRVQQMTLGDGRNNTVRIEAGEDVYSLPNFLDVGVQDPDDDLWQDPTAQLPLPALPRLLEEIPYYYLVQFDGESNINNMLSDDPDAGIFFTAAGRQQNELNARVEVDSGSGYVQTPYGLDFCPYAYLLAEISHTDTQIYVTGGKDLDLVVVGQVAQINDELVRVDAVDEDSTGTYITVGRGVLDTVPSEHILDSTGFTGADGAIVFWPYAAESDEIQYALSDEIDVRIRPVLGANVLPADQAPVDSLTFNSRAIRPYPPGDLRVDGISYPGPDDSTAVLYAGAHSITWAHRDRLQQTGGEIFDYLTGDIGPEAGTTYLVEAYSTLVGGTVTEPWLSVNVGSDTFYEQDSNTDSNISEAPPNSDRVHFRVTSLRDGYQSWQSPEVTLIYDQFDSSAFDSSEEDDVKQIIQTITNTTAGEFDFDNIPGGYSRLIIEGRLRGSVSAANDDIVIFFNGDLTAGNYHRQFTAVYNGTAINAQAANSIFADVVGATGLANGKTSLRTVIEDYASATDLKSCFTSFLSPRASRTTLYVGDTGVYSSITAPITRIRIRAANHPTNQLLGKLTLYGEL